MKKFTTRTVAGAIALIGILCALGASEPAIASYATLEPPQLTSAGSIQVVGNLTISVEDVDSETDDGLRLIVADAKSQKKIVFPFESAYRRFHLYASTLTTAKLPDIVLVTAAGDGSGATSYSVDIYQIDEPNGRLKRVYEKDGLSESYGDDPGGMWWYDFEFSLTSESLERVTLVLRNIWMGNMESKENCKRLPKEKLLELHWDSRNSRFIEHENSDSEVSSCT